MPKLNGAISFLDYSCVVYNCYVAAGVAFCTTSQKIRNLSLRPPLQLMLRYWSSPMFVSTMNFLKCRSKSGFVYWKLCFYSCLFMNTTSQRC